MSYDQKNKLARIEGSDEENTERMYDPFARDNKSESEFQVEERVDSENFPEKKAEVPGSPTVPGGIPIPGETYSLANDRPEPVIPERPMIPGGPEIIPNSNPERPLTAQPEIIPRPSSPEINVPFEPQRRDDPHDESINRLISDQADIHNKGHMDSAWVESDDDGEIKRIFPSIQNHDNLEGDLDTADENWEGENMDLDIDNDSNREDY